jgi:hypothetical protein
MRFREDVTFSSCRIWMYRCESLRYKWTKDFCLNCFSSLAGFIMTMTSLWIKTRKIWALKRTGGIRYFSDIWFSLCDCVLLIFCFFSRTPSSVSPASLKRYYFEKFLFNAVQLRVSVATVTRLPEDLKQIKSSMGLILVRLQGAVVDLGEFQKLAFSL